MQIIEIEWRNIFSYGNNIQKLTFGDEGKLWQLSGVSGSGKSSLLSIPKLLIFGKTEDTDGKTLKVGSIANRCNKHGWIKGTIRKGKDESIIERTFSPQNITVYKNGTNLEQAGIKNMQDIIDNEILDGMPYHIFSNVMNLSMNNFKSFISMSPADKRQIIDKIFSLEIVNKIYELIKKDLKDVGNAINISNSQIYSLTQTLNLSTSQLESLNNKANDDNKDELNALTQRIQKASDLYKEQSTVYAEYYEKYNAMNVAENEAVQCYNKQQIECNSILEKINLFKASKCPTCGTPFDGSAFDTLRDELNKNYTKNSELLTNLADNVNKIRKGKNTMQSSLTQLKDNMDKILRKQNELTAEYTGLQRASTQTNEYQSIQKIIDETNLAKSKLETSISESSSKMNLLNIMETLYSADGLKRQMMNNYIPTLNEEIKNTLLFLGFPYTLEFDGNFEAHLECLGQPIDNLSLGEGKKVNLAVLCSILKMLKRKYPQINLVCLDEIVSSLDYDSSSNIISYLKEIAKNMNINIFIVSHTQLDEDLFDVHINIEKENGFSHLNFM